MQTHFCMRRVVTELSLELRLVDIYVCIKPNLIIYTFVFSNHLILVNSFKWQFILLDMLPRRMFCASQEGLRKISSGIGVV